MKLKKIVNKLLNDKLIACVNYFPINVTYHWKWKIANDDYVKWIYNETK